MYKSCLGLLVALCIAIFSPLAVQACVACELPDSISQIEGIVLDENVEKDLPAWVIEFLYKLNAGYIVPTNTYIHVYEGNKHGFCCDDCNHLQVSPFANPWDCNLNGVAHTWSAGPWTLDRVSHNANCGINPVAHCEFFFIRTLRCVAFGACHATTTERMSQRAIC